MLTEYTFCQLTNHIASQGHAMAGATIAASAALACSLGEACLRINMPLVATAADRALAERIAGQLAGIRGQFQALADEDSAAITAFAALRAAGKTLEGQERLCQMPVEMARLAIEAACLLQDFRPYIQLAQDDLEMAITLLAGSMRAAALLLDSNLRLWPDPPLLAAFEPELAALRREAGRVQPVAFIRPAGVRL
jgi:formiminotetrahydrofolate cyclodeaminase